MVAPTPACEQCHPQIAARYRHVSMSETFGRVDARSSIEDVREAEFFHETKKQFYRVTRRNGHVFQERYEKDEKGGPVRAFELEATHIVGSGRHARTYLHQSENG